jgi:hypothetical protein
MATQTARTGASVFVGANSVVVQGQATRPSGTVHVVDEAWRPLCGAQRVRFMFPGADPRDVSSCPECSAALNSARKKSGEESVA